MIFGPATTPVEAVFLTIIGCYMAVTTLGMCFGLGLLLEALGHAFHDWLHKYLSPRSS